MPTTGQNILFVRCGERFLPVGDETRVITLDAGMTPEKAKESIGQVRQALAELGPNVQLRVGGPGTLWGVYGQAFEHIPTRIDYAQLNQLTKQYEVWFTNSQNL